MNDMPVPPEQPDDEQPERLSVADETLGKTRLLAEQCSTCIFRPGNLMFLSPGRLRRLVAEARSDGGYIICHQTLPYAGSPIPPAICRGFADRYSTWQLQVIATLWGFVEVPPPNLGDRHS
jgi:hypothetical protein